MSISVLWCVAYSLFCAFKTHLWLPHHPSTLHNINWESLNRKIRPLNITLSLQKTFRALQCSLLATNKKTLQCSERWHYPKPWCTSYEEWYISMIYCKGIFIKDVWLILMGSVQDSIMKHLLCPQDFPIHYTIFNYLLSSCSNSFFL